MELTNSLKKKTNSEVPADPRGVGFEPELTSRLLDSILENSSEIIFATDEKGIIQSISKAGGEILGYNPQELVGKDARKLAAEPDRLDQLFQRCLEQGKLRDLELTLRHKDGIEIPCRGSISILVNEQAKTRGFVAVCSDTSRWQKFNEELVRLDRLAETGRLAAGIVHEINNPLAVILEIIGWSKDLLADLKDLAPEHREELETAFEHIHKQTERCRSITRRVLAFARKAPPEKKEIDLKELLEETVTFLQPEFKYEDIQINFDFPSDPIKIISDPKKLEQVFVNLITNAIHAVKDKGSSQGRIRIKAALQDSFVEVSIEDNGIGIPYDIKKKIFDLFFTTKPAGTGTGLGLSISQNILKNLGGDIRFESEPGKGTTFTVKLPLVLK